MSTANEAHQLIHIGRSVSEVREIRVVVPVTADRIRHILFDSDGTISTLRQGWEQVMAPMMVEMICGETDPTAAIREEVDRYIDKSTGINTILQMEELVAMVEAHGLVTDDKIVDAPAYKRIYNDRLMVPVAARLAEIRSGSKTPADFSIRGALDFVRALAQAGTVEMRVFSGTDENDVQNELNILGVAQHFLRIHGAKDRYADSNKRQILEDLMRNGGLKGSEVVVVGDGPVEMAVAKEFGCIAIGVASDEVNRCGWNESKVDRLTKAGADVIIPDFAEYQGLLRLLLLAK